MGAVGKDGVRDDADVGRAPAFDMDSGDAGGVIDRGCANGHTKLLDSAGDAALHRIARL